MAKIPKTRQSARENFPMYDEQLTGSATRARDERPAEDQNEWYDEEVPINISAGGRPGTSSPAASVRTSATSRATKRRVPYKTTYVATSPRKPVVAVASRQNIGPSIPLRSKPASKISSHTISTDKVVNGALDGAAFTGKYAFDIFRRAVLLLRTPLSMLVFLWLLTFIISRISQTLQRAFAPLCILPGISGTALCTRDTFPIDSRQQPRWADYPKLVDVQSKTFEQLLDDSVGGSALSLEIKKAEIATTDLITLVRFSHLNSRDMLAQSLSEFVNDAKMTGRGLQKLTSKVGGAVDSIMAVNDWALHTIEAAQNKPISRFSLQKLVPWASSQGDDAVVTSTFTDAMNTLSTNMERLILEAEVNLANLNSLEERLNTLHELVTREDSSISAERSELLADLWTILGGNRKTLRGYEKHLMLLKDLGIYRQQALAHVVAALQTLRSMSEDMEDLRERVALPELVGSRIPAEVHMKSIKNGLERLKEGRVRAKRLEDDAVRRILLGIGPEEGI